MCLSIKSVFDSECSNSRLPKSKKAEFTGVIEHFFDEDNEEVGHYGQTLIIATIFDIRSERVDSMILQLIAGLILR